MEESLTHRLVLSEEAANLMATVESCMPKKLPVIDISGGVVDGHASTNDHD